jgi:alpha-amylase
MKSICLFFQVHQPLRHRRYRFFDIGNDHYYYDDYTNETTIKDLAKKSYLPANNLFLKLAKELKGKFRVAFSISGVALEQFELYAPEVIRSFQKLSNTGCVEFLSETWSHSLSSLSDKTTFEQQVKLHEKRINDLFGQKPKIFRNTEMIYSDNIGAHVYKMGYKGILTEGARHVLGWKSPNFLYVNAVNPRLKVLMRNFKLSDDITFRFSNTNWSEYPLTADKYFSWLNNLGSREEIINLFMSYESLGSRQPKESGIFDFIEHLVKKIVNSDKLRLLTPSEVIKELQPESIVNVPNPISWADEERDLTAWLGNEMQKEAFEKLYAAGRRMHNCTDDKLVREWNFLQTSDYFYYMSTKLFSDSKIQSYINPFDSPYEAFINYMNVLSDFITRLDSFYDKMKPAERITALNKIVNEKEKKIKELESELMLLRKTKRQKKQKKDKN